MVPSKHGMVIGGRGARACDMCGEERARWYCAADEAYLCQRCDISVHSANSVARRHDRVKLGSNGEPTLKLKPCRGDGRQKHLHRKTSKKSSTVVVVPTTSMCSARLDDSHHEVPKIIDSNPDATTMDIPPTHSKQWPKASTKKRARTPRKCASNPNFSKPLPADPELITDPNPNYSGAVKEEKFGEDAILLYHLLSMEDEEDNRIGNLDVKVEPLSPCSTLTSKDVTEFNKAEESESTTHQVPILCNEPLLQELINDIMPPDDLNMENILPSSIDDASYSHHNHHHPHPHPHYSSYNKTEIGCLQRCDYNGIDGLSASSISSKMDTNGTFPEGSSGIDEEGESLLINDGDSDIDTFDVMDLCSNANFGDDGDGDGDEEEIDGCDIRGDFPDMDIWKEEAPCNSIFEGNPFKGEGQRSFFDMACVKMEDSVLQSPATIAPPQPPPQLEKLLSLKLDYEEVLNAWSDRGSLWLNGQRPQMVPDILYFYGHGNLQGQYDGRLMSVMGESGGLASYGITRQVVPDSGREARVMRYREKRRTRLFAKKIRYEVRKLNAERRPRMKGRFVKRSEIATAM